MSMGPGYQGGRTRVGTKVFLNVYDLAPANEFLYPVGFGFHHSGIEVLGSEYSFASGGKRVVHLLDRVYIMIVLSLIGAPHFCFPQSSIY